MKRTTGRRWAIMGLVAVACTAMMAGAGQAAADEGNDTEFRLPPLAFAAGEECEHEPTPVPEPEPTPEPCVHPTPTTPVEPTPEPTVVPPPEPTVAPTPEPTVDVTPEPTVLPSQPTPTPTSTEVPAVTTPAGGSGPSGGQGDELARTGPSTDIGLVVFGLTASAAGLMVLATRRRLRTD